MLNNLKKVRNQKGFTLVELVVVIAILGVLAAIAVPRLVSATDNAKTAKIRADLRTIDSAYAMYQAQTGLTITDKAAVDSNSALVPNYLPTAPKPPKGYDGGGYYIESARGAYSSNGSTFQYADAPGDNPYTKKDPS